MLNHSTNTKKDTANTPLKTHKNKKKKVKKILQLTAAGAAAGVARYFISPSAAAPAESFVSNFFNDKKELICQLNLLREEIERDTKDLDLITSRGIPQVEKIPLTVEKKEVLNDIRSVIYMMTLCLTEQNNLISNALTEITNKSAFFDASIFNEEWNELKKEYKSLIELYATISNKLITRTTEQVFNTNELKNDLMQIPSTSSGIENQKGPRGNILPSINNGEFSKHKTPTDSIKSRSRGITSEDILNQYMSRPMPFEDDFELKPGETVTIKKLNKNRTSEKVIAKISRF